VLPVRASDSIKAEFDSWCWRFVAEIAYSRRQATWWPHVIEGFRPSLRSSSWRRRRRSPQARSIGFIEQIAPGARCHQRGLELLARFDPLH